ncbi:hypothetical protein ACQPZJ_37915 [Actinoplanes sp. CA-054009]
MLEIAVPAAVEKDGKTDDSGSLLLAGLRHTANRAMKALEAGEDRVTREEQDFQERRSGWSEAQATTSSATG